MTDRLASVHRSLVKALVGFVGILVVVHVAGILIFRSCDVPGSDFNYQENLEKAKRHEKEKEEKRNAARELAAKMTRKRGIEQDLKDADERTRKLQMLKIQYEAALIVGADTSRHVRDAALDLAVDSADFVRILDELEVISERVRRCKDEVSRRRWEKPSNSPDGQGGDPDEEEKLLVELADRLHSATTEEERKKWMAEMDKFYKEHGGWWARRPEAKTSAEEIDFAAALQSLAAATTDVDRLAWAHALKEMSTLGQSEVSQLCEYLDTLGDVKMRYITLDVLTALARGLADSSPEAAALARSKLIGLLGRSTDWTEKAMIGHALAACPDQNLKSEQKAALLRAFEQEQNPLVREELIRALGACAGHLYADKFLQISESEKSPEVRATAIEYLDGNKPEHKMRLLSAIQADPSEEVKQRAWMAIFPAFQLQIENDNQDMTSETYAMLLRKNVLDPDIHGAFIQAVRGDYGNGHTRLWLLQEYIFLAPKLFSLKTQIGDVLKQLADNDPDEDIREAAKDALDAYDTFQRELKN